MKKHFILSTRTLVSKRNVTQSFGQDNNVYVPLAVMEEIESRYASQMSERGKIAREIIAYLSSFHINDLKKGVVQENGSILRVTTNYNSQILPESIQNTECSKLDIRILQTCMGIKKQVPEEEPVILVSKKGTLRKKAEMIGVKAQPFKDELLPEISEQYTGRKTIWVSQEIIEKFREENGIPIRDIISNEEEEKEYYPNMFIELRCGYQVEEGRIFKDKIIPLSYKGYFPYRAIPKNSGQRFMIEALMMDPDIAPLVIIKGPAGTGKTYISLAVALEQLFENHKYPDKILCSRSVTESGEKIGYLPGSEEEKMAPFMRGIKDNLKRLINGNQSEYKKNCSGNRENKKKNGQWNQENDEKPYCEDGTIFFERGDIQVQSLGYIRGRTICDTYIIIDEAQNLTPTEVKTIITRVGTGTKLVLMGDPAQIDRAEVDERNNGLSYASERLKGVENCWQITMEDEESVRSKLAKLAAMIL